MKNLAALLLSLMIMAGAAFAYMPPVYIASQETGECRYYFAGDSAHFNELPEGNWLMVGLSGENRTTCSEACLINTYGLWKTAGYGNLTKERYIWTTLGCDCLGEGTQGCDNWCLLSKGYLNETNWSSSVKCICRDGKWQPGKGCQAETNTTASESRMQANANYFEIIAAVLFGLIAGYVISSKFKFSIKKQAHENKDHGHENKEHHGN